MSDRRYVTGLFETDESAAVAVENLISESFPIDEIAVLKSVGDEAVEVELEHKTGIPTGAAVGGAVGAALGMAGASLVSIGALSVPPIGLAAAGPLTAALEGLVVGGAAGSLVGTLAGLGFWKDELDVPESLGEGAVLVGVPAQRERRAAARHALAMAGAESLEG